MEKPIFWKRQWTQAAAAYFAVWLICTLFLAVTGGNFLFPISSLVLFGMILTGVAVFLTRKADAPPVPVAHPKRESLTLLAYLLVYALVLFGPLASIIRDAITSETAEQVAMLAYKLVVHLLIPALLIRAAGGHLRGIFDLGVKRPGVLVTLLLFSAFMIIVVGLLNSIFDQLSAKGLGAATIAAWLAFSWIWMSIEAGACEEFLFRGLLQSRFTAWFGSPPMAIVAMSVIFALVHVPSFYLRGGEAVAQQAGSLPQIIALAVASIAPISIMLGTLWYRTRSFLLVIMVHGAIDALPAVDKMMRIWS